MNDKIFGFWVLGLIFAIVACSPSVFLDGWKFKEDLWFGIFAAIGTICVLIGLSLIAFDLLFLS